MVEEEEGIPDQTELAEPTGTGNEQECNPLKWFDKLTMSGPEQSAHPELVEGRERTARAPRIA